MPRSPAGASTRRETSVSDSGENGSASNTTGNQSAGPAGACLPGLRVPDGTQGTSLRQKQSIPPWFCGPEVMRNSSRFAPAFSETLPTFDQLMKRRSGLLSAAMFIAPRWPAPRSMSRHSPPFSR